MTTADRIVALQLQLSAATAKLDRALIRTEGRRFGRRIDRQARRIKFIGETRQKLIELKGAAA